MKTNERKRFWYLAIGLSFVICLLSFSPAQAQTFTQRLQKSAKGEGHVTVHHDKAIDELVNGPKAVAMPSTPAVKPAIKKEVNIKEPVVSKPAAKGTEEKTAPVAAKQKAATTQTTDTTRTVVATPLDTVQAKPRRTYHTTGYRVQVYAGGNSRADRQQAERIGNQLRALFPAHQVYVHFYSPRWLCRIGNFKEYEEANHLRNELKQMGYRNATIVKGKITLPQPY